MPSLDDFLRLSERYLTGAEILLDKREYDSAYYLAGYSVECLIKAVICKNVKAGEFPPKNTNKIYSHEIDQLIEAADLQGNLDFDKERSKSLKESYLVLKDWNPKESRYQHGVVDQKKAEDFLGQIKNKEGFVEWLKKYL